MNKAILVGRLTRDPELRTTANGTSVCTFSIAVNRRFRNAEGGYDDYCAGDLAVDNFAEELLVNGKNEIDVKGFPEGTNTSIDNPLVVWVAMAPGTYENFVVEIKNADMTISCPVKGPFVVEKCAITENAVEAREVRLDNGFDDFVGENGEFNPEN